MSTTTSTTSGGGGVTSATTTTTTSSSSFFMQNLSSLGLSYAIAIALGFFVLLSALLLVSYVCCRASSRRRNPNPNPNVVPDAGGGSNGVVLPRVIFVPEDDDDSEDGAGDRSAASATGLDPAAISSYPRFPFSAAKGGDAMCSICLCDYREGEMLRMMPDCRHYFHLPCIDAWLRLNASCPVCRTSPMPTPVSTPLSTPLSELVPLSHFAADRRRS